MYGRDQLRVWSYILVGTIDKTDQKPNQVRVQAAVQFIHNNNTAAINNFKPWTRKGVYALGTIGLVGKIQISKRISPFLRQAELCNQNLWIVLILDSLQDCRGQVAGHNFEVQFLLPNPDIRKRDVSLSQKFNQARTKPLVVDKVVRRISG